MSMSMTRTMSSAPSPTTLSSPSPSGYRLPGPATTTFQSRFATALKQPFPEKCYQVSQLIQEAVSSNSKDIQGCFVPLLENVFGFGGQSADTDWSLKTASRDLYPREHELIFAFLHPNGVVFQLIRHLMRDPSFRCEFPVNCLPVPTKLMLDEGVVPGFYLNRISLSGQVSFNSLEYYLFLFTHYIQSNNNKGSEAFLMNDKNWNYSSLVYVTLLEAYLNYFLPVTAVQVSAGKSLTSPSGHSLWESFSSTTSNLLHLGSGSNVSQHGSQQQIFPTSTLLNLKPLLSRSPVYQYSSRDESQQASDSLGNETWKSEVFITILTEMWLNISVPPSLAKKRQSPSHLQASVVPNTGHMLSVRVFVKHLHLFANSAPNKERSEGSPTALLDELKRTIWTNRFMVQRKFYGFLRLCFEHWPLDASFRLPLETWLSFIQPWRYLEPGAGGGAALDNEDKENPTGRESLDTHWKNFIYDNLLFYSVVFSQVVTRFLRLDLVSSKNAYMLFRLAKVFSQTNLGDLVREAEAGLERSSLPTAAWSSFAASPRGSLLTPSFRGNSSTTANSTSLSHQLLECEHQGFVYVSLFSPQIKSQMVQLVTKINQANAEAIEMVKSTQQSSTVKSDSFFSSIVSFFVGQDSVKNDDEFRNAAEYKKIESHLTFSMNRFSQLFQVEATFEPNISPNLIEASIRRRKHMSSPSTPKLPKPDTIFDETGAKSLSAFGRYQVMNRLCKPNVGFEGNPDLQPVRTYEIALMVTLLKWISDRVNLKYGPSLNKFYGQNSGILGKLCRTVLSPPVNFVRVNKTGVSNPPERVVESLPARVSLRVLANKTLIAYTFLFSLLSYALGVSLFSFLMVTLFVVLIYTLTRGLLGQGRSDAGNAVYSESSG